MPPLHLFPQLLLLVLFLSADVTDAGTDSNSDSNRNSNSDSNSDSAELRTEAALKLLYAGLPDWPSSDADRTSIKSHTENTFGPDRCGMEPPRELHLLRSWLSASGDFPLAAPLPFPSLPSFGRASSLPHAHTHTLTLPVSPATQRRGGVQRGHLRRVSRPVCPRHVTARCGKYEGPRCLRRPRLWHGQGA